MKSTKSPSSAWFFWCSRVKRYAKKGMYWGFRLLLLTVMIVLVLFAVAWLTMLKVFNAQQLSQSITHQLQKVFNRPVVISSLDLKFINVIELKGFAILDNEVEPGLPLVAAESVLIRYQLLPLLDHKLIIDEVTLNRPRIDLIRSEKGRYNVPPIKITSTPETYVNEPTGQKFQIDIEDWTIKDGVISFRDRQSGASHAVYGLNMHFNQLHFNEWSKFRFTMVLRNRWQGNISELEIRGFGKVHFADFKWEKFGLQDIKTQVAVFRKPVSMTVNIENLRTPHFTLQAKSPAFNQQDLSVFAEKLPAFNVPQATWSVKGHLDESFTHLTLEKAEAVTHLTKVSASGKIDFTPAPYTVDLQVKTGGLNLAQLPDHWPALKQFQLAGQANASAHLLRKDGRYSLPQLEINAKDVSGSFWGFETEKISGQFVSKQNFSDLYAQTTEGTVRVADTTFENLQLTASYRKGNVYAYISSALLNTVPLKLRLSINKIKQKNRDIATSIYLEKFDPMGFIGVVRDFADVISAIPKNPSPPHPLQEGELAWMRNFRDRLPTFMPNFSGTLYADELTSEVLSGKRFNAEFAFTGLLPGAADLDGTLDMRLEEGTIHQMEKVAEEQQALNVTYTPFIMLHRMESSGSFKVGEVLKDVLFDEMATSVDFKKGTMIINNAFTHGPVISAAVSGWTDWVRETFELVIWTMITPSSRRGILAENLTDENGNPALAFKVASSMLKPKLEMLRAKKTNTQIQTAQKRGLRTEFIKNQEFIKGEFNAKK